MQSCEIINSKWLYMSVCANVVLENAWCEHVNMSEIYGYAWACWFMTLASFCLDFQPMFAQSDWLIGQLTARRTLCSANSITQPVGLKRRDTWDIQGLRLVWKSSAASCNQGFPQWNLLFCMHLVKQNQVSPQLRLSSFVNVRESEVVLLQIDL